MYSVVCGKKEGYAFYFAFTEAGAPSSGGGLTAAGELVCEPSCAQKELLLRALINKCMNDFVPAVRTRDIWGVDLARFGFVREGEMYASSWDKLKLPHDCAGK